ncbi:MAG: class I SAM-dependent methyltransferase [Bacteroidetes bacterium]|nr:class I SAM-dependent methyltransferase [Bacteroidota bacterium]
MDNEKVRDFWDRRAKEQGASRSFAVTNLETDSKLQEKKVALERAKVTSILKLTPRDRLLDLGCGVGAWSLFFSTEVEEIVGVDYSEAMLEVGRKNAERDGVRNVSFVCSEASDFCSHNPFSVVFVSGLILYLNDSSLNRMLSHLEGSTTSNARLFLREPAGIPKRYIIENRWSSALQSNYSAIYRTRLELIYFVEQFGFELESDSDMFPEGSPLNKWAETRLRVYQFIKQ